jgi:hypothetical protein
MWLNDPIENIHIQWDMIILIIFLTSFSKLSDIPIQPESGWLQNILLLMKNKYNIQNYHMHFSFISYAISAYHH